MSDHRPLAIVAGTTVPEAVGGTLAIGPFHVPVPRVQVARLVYSQFEALSPKSRTFGLSMLGFAHSRHSYATLLPRFEEFLDGEKGDFLGDSQGGYPAVEFAYAHPDQVENLILLSVPNRGTDTWLAKAVDTPGTRCMREGSRYASRIEGMVAELAATSDGPKVTCISSGHDYLVPRQSALLEGVPGVNSVHVFHRRPIDLHPDVRHVHLRHGWMLNHLSEVLLRHTADVVRNLLASPRLAEAVVDRTSPLAA